LGIPVAVAIKIYFPGCKSILKISSFSLLETPRTLGFCNKVDFISYELILKLEGCKLNGLIVIANCNLELFFIVMLSFDIYFDKLFIRGLFNAVNLFPISIVISSPFNSLKE